MASKASFSPEEWTTVLQSVMMAGIAVTAAEPSGLWGTLRESMVAGHALLEAKSDTKSSELIKAVATDFETSEGRAAARDRLQATLTGSKPGEVKAKAVAAVRDAAVLLDAKAPDEAPTFKAWLRHISQAVAEASTEGGFLGFGGVRVSEAEKATLAEISGALGVKG
jgi:hypothetical protein